MVAIEVEPQPLPYERGQRLAVLLEGETAYLDATVEDWAGDQLRSTRHLIKLDKDGTKATLDLNKANHARQECISRPSRSS